MTSLVEWVGGTVIMALFCWIFFAPHSPEQAHQPERHKQMKSWCKLDKALDTELLAIMGKELPPGEKLEVYKDFRRRDKELIEMARQYQQRWGQHPGIACYNFSQ